MSVIILLFTQCLAGKSHESSVFVQIYLFCLAPEADRISVAGTASTVNTVLTLWIGSFIG